MRRLLHFIFLLLAASALAYVPEQKMFFDPLRLRTKVTRDFGLATATVAGALKPVNKCFNFVGDWWKARKAKKAAEAAEEAAKWKLGKGKSTTTWANQMKKRGWTDQQVTETLQGSKGIPTKNMQGEFFQALKALALRLKNWG